MELNNLFNDDRAVSPVIGVILMVAITVILAAVIGTFVLGLGDSLSQTSPQATYDWSQTEIDSANYTVTVEHTGGDTLTNTTISLSGDVSNGTDNALGNAWANSQGEISAGQSVTIGDEGTGADVWTDGAIEEGNDVQVVWSASGGGSSSVLTEYTVS